MAEISDEKIESFVEKVVDEFDPEKIILFGSHARAGAASDSDVDLLVIMDFQGRAHQQAFQIRKKIGRSFPLDLLVRRPSEIKRRLKMGDFFIREIMQGGKVLYDRTGR
jgi:predicted nucleotidyltransferase